MTILSPAWTTQRLRTCLTITNEKYKGMQHGARALGSIPRTGKNKSKQNRNQKTKQNNGNKKEKVEMLVMALCAFRTSQPQHCCCFGPNKSLLRWERGLSCALQDIQWRPWPRSYMSVATPIPPVLVTNMSSDIVRHPQGSKIAPS